MVYNHGTYGIYGVPYTMIMLRMLPFIFFFSVYAYVLNLPVFPQSAGLIDLY